MSDEDVYEVATPKGKCPECGGNLLNSMDDAGTYDDEGEFILEITPEWCPICGWEPA